MAKIYFLLDRRNANLNQQTKAITSKTADSNSSNKTTGKVKLSSKLEVEETSAELATYQTTLAFKKHEPRHTIATIHPSNYGDRYSADLDGNLLNIEENFRST